jgi:hypothetical protein
MVGVLVRPSDGPRLEQSARDGNAKANAIFTTATNYLTSVKDGQQTCACCGREFKEESAPSGVYVLCGDGPAHIAVGLCWKCVQMPLKRLSRLLDGTLSDLMLASGYRPPNYREDS